MRRIRWMLLVAVLFTLLGAGLVLTTTHARADAGYDAAGGDGSKEIRVVRTAEMVVAISGDGRRLSAYGLGMGQWSPLVMSQFGGDNDMRITQQDLKIGLRVVAYSRGRRVFAFSSLSGAWDALELPAGVTPTITAADETVTVQYPNTLALFDARTGRWNNAVFQ